jgi:formylglycine-generating enzyme required for sulfatase activity
MTRSVFAIAIAACGTPAGPVAPTTPPQAPLSAAADARMVMIPAGKYIAGSTPEEREAAYDDYEQSGYDSARKHEWFKPEKDRHLTELPAFRIDMMPVTNAEYLEFVLAGHAPAPTIDEPTWKAQRFIQDYATEVTRFLWVDGRPPPKREDHPAVLVTHDEAVRYCAWRGKRRLPTSDEYEKAARGTDGFAYPWGNTYEASKLNSAIAGPRDTVPAGSFPDGASPFGVLDMAGNVFQWTATPMPGQPGRMIVKGSAWEDFGGIGRAASIHGRLTTIRHIIVGFRCASDP